MLVKVIKRKEEREENINENFFTIVINGRKTKKKGKEEY